MAYPNSKAPLGQGGRFAALKQKLAKRPGVTNPGALAAAIGRKKYGASKMASMAAHGSGPFSQSEVKQGFKVMYTAERLRSMDNERSTEATLAKRRLPKTKIRSEA